MHFYSSHPVVLAPADLYKVKSNPYLQDFLMNCNVYIIATRLRILIDPEEFRLESGILHGHFIVLRSTGTERIPFRWKIPDYHTSAQTLEIDVIPSGTQVTIRLDGRESTVLSHILVAGAESELRKEDTDLDVLYIGQGIGRSKKRNAIDRLLGHSTLQRILSSVVTFSPAHEILLLLYRFEHSQTFMSTGGDLSAEPTSNCEEERDHMNRMSSVTLSRHEKVALVEAALIKHFQPWFNVQLKGSDFSGRKKIKVLVQLLKKDLTGLIVEICTSNISSRLKTEQAKPIELSELFEPAVLNGSNLKSNADKLEWRNQLHAMAHTHIANFPLTNPEERDTFMHGTLWNGENERMGFLG